MTRIDDLRLSVYRPHSPLPAPATSLGAYSGLLPRHQSPAASSVHRFPSSLAFKKCGLAQRPSYRCVDSLFFRQGFKPYSHDIGCRTACHPHQERGGSKGSGAPVGTKQENRKTFLTRENWVCHAGYRQQSRICPAWAAEMKTVLPLSKEGTPI